MCVCVCVCFTSGKGGGFTGALVLGLSGISVLVPSVS